MSHQTAQSPPGSPAAPLMLSVSGCRGLVGSSFTPTTITAFTAAAAARLKLNANDDNPTVILARDGRHSGQTATRIVAGTLLASGCRVIDLGVATTPTAGVMVDHHNAAGALVITASHNPGEWNGIKVIGPNAAAPPKAEADQIIADFHAGQTSFADHAALGSIEADDTASHVHVARVLDAIEPVTPTESIRAHAFRVVVDAVNGSGARPAKLLLEALGCKVSVINEQHGVPFAHEPEPTRENLTELARFVPSVPAAVGFAQDPDADRLAIIDNNGSYIGEEYTLALAAWAWLDGMPKKQAAGTVLAANLSTSRMIDDVATRFGARVQRTAVGEANLTSWMLPNGSPIGGEGNGGVIWPEVVPIRDSIGSMALVLSLMARTGRTLDDLVRQIPAYAIVKRKAPADGDIREKAEAAIRRLFPDASVNTDDGVRADVKLASGGDAWVHVRASNTEPIFRLIAEAPTEAEANEMLDRTEAALGEA